MTGFQKFRNRPESNVDESRKAATAQKRAAEASEQEERMTLAPVLEALTGTAFIADHGEGLITKLPISKLDPEPYQAVMALCDTPFASVTSSCPVMPATRKMNEDHMRVVVEDRDALILFLESL